MGGRSPTPPPWSRSSYQATAAAPPPHLPNQARPHAAGEPHVRQAQRDLTRTGPREPRACRRPPPQSPPSQSERTGLRVRARDRCPRGGASPPHPHSRARPAGNGARGPPGGDGGASRHAPARPASLPRSPRRQPRGRRKFQEKRPLLMAATAGAGYAPEVPAGGQRRAAAGSEGWAAGERPSARAAARAAKRRGAAWGRRPGQALHYPSFFSFFPPPFFFWLPGRQPPLVCPQRPQWELPFPVQSNPVELHAGCVCTLGRGPREAGRCFVPSL